MNYEELIKLKKENPYSLTLKEWNHIKKKVISIIPDTWQLYGKKEGDRVRLSMYVQIEDLAVSRITLEYIKGGYLRTFFKDETKEILSRVKNLVESYNITHSESDIYSDYAGAYRFSSIIQLHVSGEIEDALIEIGDKLTQINKDREDSRISFCHDDFRQVCEELGHTIKL